MDNSGIASAGGSASMNGAAQRARKHRKIDEMAAGGKIASTLLKHRSVSKHKKKRSNGWIVAAASVCFLWL